jgi:hypothetical protein
VNSSSVAFSCPGRWPRNALVLPEIVNISTELATNESGQVPRERYLEFGWRPTVLCSIRQQREIDPPVGRRGFDRTGSMPYIGTPWELFESNLDKPARGERRDAGEGDRGQDNDRHILRGAAKGPFRENVPVPAFLGTFEREVLR